MLWQHDANQPIGGWTSLVEDDYGLLCHGQILLSIPKGREDYELLKDGTIHSFSIGYDVMTGGSTYVKNTRVLTALRLWELSVVTFPMCEEATLESIKSYTKHSVRYHYEQAISR
jgi:HK97 family phage prohead protease